MYVNSALNFTGSKFKLLPQLLPQMDYTKKYFVDLFCGSFVVGSNVVDKFQKVLANDIIQDLVEIHYNIINKSDKFILDVKSLVVSNNDQDGFNKLRESYNKNKSPEKLYALLLCSTNNMLRFSQTFKYNQTFGKRSFNPSTEKKLEEYIKHIQPYKDKIIFTSKSFNDIKLKKPSMVYIDPPYGYVLNNNDIGNKQISEAGYNAFYKKEDDIKLFNYILDLNKNGHSFMVSGLLEHNDKVSWLMTKLVKSGFNYKELDFDYNKVSRKGDKNSVELIITNF
jgi:DNA adenine methylase Dam